jgi:hypothetical protein
MFAQGGATISDDFVKNPAEGTIPFIKQAKNFVEAVKTNPLNFEKAMAIVVMGMNDIRLAASTFTFIVIVLYLFFYFCVEIFLGGCCIDKQYLGSYKQYNTPEKLSGDLASSYFEAIDIVRQKSLTLAL